jgi:hypothetical protein
VPAAATDEMLLFEEIVVISEARSWIIKAEPCLGMYRRGFMLGLCAVRLIGGRTSISSIPKQEVRGVPRTR